MNRSDDFEIYIHIPFCVRKCGYCDFLSFHADEEIRESYVAALLREIRSTGAEGDRKVSSVFLGGGTPSLLSPEQIRRIFLALRGRFWLREDAEITMEANPGTLDRKRLLEMKRCGVNRLSLGLQSADNRFLRILGRIHSFEDFLESYALSRECGFSNINVDLMFALPEQSRKDWEESLRKTALLGPEHISAYSLMIEEGTPFASRSLILPDEDTEYAMYEDSSRILGEYGFEQYEISNYARPGFSCRHNIGYWKRREYLGFGLGAASFFGGRRYANTRSMEKYLSRSSLEDIRENIQPVSREEAMEEFMFLGLRLTEGVSREDFFREFGCSMDRVYGPVLRKYLQNGFLIEEKDRIRLSRRGIHVSNTILSDFIL